MLIFRNTHGKVYAGLMHPHIQTSQPIKYQHVKENEPYLRHASFPLLESMWCGGHIMWSHISALKWYSFWRAVAHVLSASDKQYVIEVNYVSGGLAVNPTLTWNSVSGCMKQSLACCVMRTWKTLPVKATWLQFLKTGKDFSVLSNKFLTRMLKSFLTMAA